MGLRGFGYAQQEKMSESANWPERSFRRRVRTAAVLAVLCNLIVANHDASAFSKAGSIFIFSFFKQTPVFFGENVRCKVKGNFF